MGYRYRLWSNPVMKKRQAYMKKRGADARQEEYKTKD